jgi:diamine N-acetyltransferase
MTLCLRAITRENWYQCTQLQLRPDQQDFVSPVVLSLAQSRFEPERVPLAIYDDDTLVGFLMYNDQPLHDDSYRISRVLIDQKYQGQGYGRQAVLQVIERMRHIPQCKEILIEYSPENTVAARLYTSLGFEPLRKTEYGVVNGKLDYDILARLQL